MAREQYLQDALADWARYRETGLHVTEDEADASAGQVGSG
jgi:predicted transcriptional regulator